MKERVRLTFFLFRIRSQRLLVKHLCNRPTETMNPAVFRELNPDAHANDIGKIHFC